ncbi:UNVERIFIED_CONTAM: hypothetical protein Slati_0387000 [Sesamum latifolium]|uniref:Uncharacterized protein n=1 Tax=Sesamum latifolium TaxID=2727402 RepID=A0AAW2XVC4_9LAMI
MREKLLTVENLALTISVSVMDDLTSSSVIWVCRICYEEEFESCRSLEAPCACSGTLKKFRPGYTSPPKITHTLHTTVTIRGSWEVPRIEPEPENTGESPETDYSHCAAAADRKKQISGSNRGYPFSLLTVHSSSVFYLAHNDAPAPVMLPVNKVVVGFLCAFVQVLIVKAGGILVPMYTLIRILGVIHNRIKYQGYQNPDADLLSSDDEDGEQHSNAEIQP